MCPIGRGLVAGKRGRVPVLHRVPESRGLCVSVCGVSSHLQNTTISSTLLFTSPTTPTLLSSSHVVTLHVSHPTLTRDVPPQPEFDYLKSLEIEEKINQIKWLPRRNVSRSWLHVSNHLGHRRNIPGCICISRSNDVHCFVPPTRQ